MNEMTMSGFKQFMASEFVRGCEHMIIQVQNGDDAPETIINPSENFEKKMEYYEKAYTEDLHLKANPAIRIVSYDATKYLSDYFAIEY